MTRAQPGDFGPFGEKMRAAGLPAAAIRSFAADYEKLASGSRGTISESDIVPVGALPHRDELADHAGAGRDFVRRTAVIKQQSLEDKLRDDVDGSLGRPVVELDFDR